MNFKFLKFSLLIILNYLTFQKVKLSKSPTRLQFSDETNSELTFHGTNAVVKGHPWYPTYDAFDADISLSDRDFALMKHMGINLVRLGTMWPGVEPKYGQQDQTQINHIRSIIQKGKEYGVYFLLDMHQDALNRQQCGEGFPEWIERPNVKFDFLRFPFPVSKALDINNDQDENGFPFQAKCNEFDWAVSELSQEMSFAYEIIYTKYKIEFANAWKFIANNLNDLDNIIGYELINEPFPGNIYKYPWKLFPSMNEQTLLEFQDGAVDAIRSVDAVTPIVQAGKVLDDFGSGFDRNPGKYNADSNMVLAFHQYSNVNIFGFDYQITNFVKSAETLKTAVLLSEFGVPSADPFNHQADFPEQHDVTRAAENNFVSQAYWEWKTFCNDSYGACITGFGNKWNGNLPFEQGVGIQQRTFAYKINGQATYNNFDNKTGEQGLEYEQNQDVENKTEIQLSCKFDGKLIVDIVPSYIEQGIESSNCGSGVEFKCNILKINDYKLKNKDSSHTQKGLIKIMIKQDV